MKLIQRDYSIEAPYIDRLARKGWIAFGVNNNFPLDLIETVNQSPLQKSILESQITAVLGGGLRPTDKNYMSPNLTESWFDLIRKCVTDFVYLNAFAVQVIPNKGGNSFSFYHQPCDQIRLGQYEEDNMIHKAYLCTDWTRASKKNIVEIKMFGSETPKQGERYLMYFKPNAVGEMYYAIPRYYSAMNWVLADAALSRYYNNYIHNDFSASMKVVFPSTPNDETKKELYENLQRCFAGERNSGNIVVLFGEGGALPDIQPIQQSNADLYNTVVEIVTKQIVSANRLTSPVLAGISTASGFSSKADELIAAYTLYKITVINDLRNFVLDKMNFLLSLNGLDRCLEIADIDFRAEYEGKTEKNDEVERDAVGIEGDNDEDNNQQKDEEEQDGNTE